MTAGKVGDLLKQWRHLRRFSQLDLALEADVSQRHLSFVESGRAIPSRDMVLHLSRHLEVPLRDRNAMLAAAGYAPEFPEQGLRHPQMVSVKRALDLLLRALEPFPALAIDRHWSVVATNAAVAPLLQGVDEDLLSPPINLVRISLHPRGLSKSIRNLPQWRRHLMDRLRLQYKTTADAAIAALLREVASYPQPTAAAEEHGDDECAGVVVPLKLASPRGPLSFINTTTTFVAPIEVAISEIAIETLLPADDLTRHLLGATK